METHVDSIKTVIAEIDQIARAAALGELNTRMDMSSLEGDSLAIASGVNDTLDIICSHLNVFPVALALFNGGMKMVYRNEAMEDFLLMHDLDGDGENLLERIAGSGGLSPGNSLDPKVQAIFDPALPDPAPYSADIALLGHNGGSNYSMTIRRAGTGGRNRNSVCAVLLLSDVTMLTRVKIDAEMASRAKSDFLSRMSHEIRTPMNAVIGMTQIAKNSSDLEKIRGCLSQVESSSNHLLGVINDILDFSKMESGKLHLDLTEFSLGENLDFVLSMMRPRARQRNIDIRLCAENIRNDGLYADSLRLNQVLINLLSNAIKFSPEESEIILNVRELGQEDGFSIYSFEVIDHGIGISEYQASKLFRPFEQATRDITRDYGGTGLGLAISKNLVEMMHGKISLDSTPGKGSAFTFTIRCESKPAFEKKVPAREAAAAETVYDFSGKRCLVVDDIDINREIIMELLSGTHLAMETAVNGQDAVNKFKSSNAGYFDVILMDMQMPVMDGCSATEEIRRIEKQRAAEHTAGKAAAEVLPTENIPTECIPIIAMTANVLQEDIQKAVESGMTAHLGKPIVLETTLRTLHEQLTKHT